MKRSTPFFWTGPLVAAILIFLSIGGGTAVRVARDDSSDDEEVESRDETGMIDVTFRNELPEPVMIFYEGDDQRYPQGDGPIEPLGGERFVRTFPGHRFTYDYGGERHWIDARATNDLELLLADNTEILVKCTTTADGFRSTGQQLNIRVIPWWSPRGASRFLELVREQYYDGCALNRVVPRFLTQFGLSADTALRRKWRSRSIRDDPKRDGVPKFVPGMISYAGSGEDSRYGEVFIVMPDAPRDQLDQFGSNSWETPFGIVQGLLDETPISRWHVTGDMPPWGSGPDTQRIHTDDGYEYLSREFPELDYIESCVVEEIAANEEEEEKEL
mmetsp:Transcript_23002/g.49918  ORF Transcript_23002/g.49918 Transcript_23002/m.49918 type:complete len:330 (-) Transcript_23002:175-1164(-)|eukprot:CAMPEP_0178487078 /NCGR_PEP_ID=MMETSP0696-20121128/9137_1 /TAXON_ID=265572 /ORGANISM="Extubocellulus spinifer, Strain CCMP396" /LENGTH=329 /DNA_ID=CAMNT_0020114761 /DNA_START=67 /DNA_END=1056 /DNA_ORIENTATION=-